MAGPRIKNITPDELRRLFEAPEIQSPPPLSVAEGVSLAEAFAGRERKDAEDKAKIAEIERELERAEQEQQLTQQLLTPAQAPVRELETAAGAVPTTQIGLPVPGQEDVTPVASQADLEQLRAEQTKEGEIASLEAQIDPLGVRKDQKGTEAAEREFSEDKELEQLKQAGRVELEKFKAAFRNQGKLTKLSGLQQSNIVKNKGFEGLVNTIAELEKSVPRGGGFKGPTKRFLASLQAFAGGNLPDSFGSADVVTFSDLRESAAVAVYKYLSGDVGNIAASESARALKLVPGLRDSDDVRARKLKLLKGAVKNAERALKALAANPATANLSTEQLRQAQAGIADNAIASAATELTSALPADEAQEVQESIIQETGGFEILSEEDE